MRTDYEQIAASVERLGEERDLLRTELSDTKVERDAAWAKIKALKATKEQDEAFAVSAVYEHLACLLGLHFAPATDAEGQQLVHAAIERLKVERDALREAARALLADLDRPIGSMPWGCRECDRVSTCRANGACYCDEHSYEGAKDATYAAPLRALRALLEGKP